MRCALAVGMMAAVLSFAPHAQERGGSSTSESAQAQSNGPDRSSAPSRAGSTATTVPRVPPVAGFPMSPSETMSLPGQPSQPFSPPPPSSVPSPVMSLPSVPASPPASAPPTSSTSCPRDQGAAPGVSSGVSSPTASGVPASQFTRAGVAAEKFERPGVSAAQLATLLPGRGSQVCAVTSDLPLLPANTSAPRPSAVSRHRALLSTRPSWITTGYEVRFAAS